MLTDALGHPRYADKPMEQRTNKPSPELLELYREMELNPRFHISRECNFYPAGFPSCSPGWSLG